VRDSRTVFELPAEAGNPKKPDFSGV